MLHNRLIPSLLLEGGRLVKGTKFQDRRDAGRPETTARAHNAQGADELLLLDVTASREGREPDFETIALVAEECFMPLCVGGGVSSAETAMQCMNCGADKIFVNAAAMDRPELINELAERFGSQAVMVGIDVMEANGEAALYDHRTGEVAPRGWKDWMREAASLGAGEIRLMSVDREGTRQSMNTDLLREAEALVDLPVILEGGAGNVADIDRAMTEGATAVAVGTMLVFSDNNIIQIKRHLANHGHNMRH